MRFETQALLLFIGGWLALGGACLLVLVSLARNAAEDPDEPAGAGLVVVNLQVNTLEDEFAALLAQRPRDRDGLS